MTLNSDLIVGTICAVISVVVYFSTRDLSYLGGIFINYLLVALGFLSLTVLAKGFIRPEKIRLFESVIERNNVAVGVLILAGYLAIMPVVGFLPASFIFYAVFSLYLSEEKLSSRGVARTTLLSAVVVLFFYLVFNKILEVPLPPGMIFES